VQADAIFPSIEPLSRRYVSLTTDAAGEADSRVTQIGIWTLVTKGGVVTIREETRKQVGFVNQGRWRMLTAGQDQIHAIKALPGWITQLEADPHSSSF
jgi:hypothetical protein